MSTFDNKPKIIHPYGPKKTGYNRFFEEMDITDQRAPINDPQSLFEQFVINDEIQDELDEEAINDFDADIYDYEDRTEYGIDVAAAAQNRVAPASLKKMFGKKSSKNNS